MTQAAVPHGTQGPHITVRGEAHLEVAPEIARITITVHARDHRTTPGDVTRRNTTVLAPLKEYGPAVDPIDTGAFSLGPEHRRTRGPERSGNARGTRTPRGAPGTPRRGNGMHDGQPPETARARPRNTPEQKYGTPSERAPGSPPCLSEHLRAQFNTCQ
ncbi:SIMPL domain-containing protein [Streptomyces sp. MUM 136J]|uniref:SIMPL domain-containing protein n=1 Tax=Streptomyces sp. MUM 136J TaxID=2791992 RepID=UPI0027E5B217|nr:SIMPL domain-containing protein [Streptomyces sp. MUM 136J]MCH0567733.1 SIMPL domain-containing protein [Streptomyces sp. MUM 136J]